MNKITIIGSPLTVEILTRDLRDLFNVAGDVTETVEVGPFAGPDFDAAITRHIFFKDTEEYHHHDRITLA